MESVKLQTASLMRLNALWGLEVKDPAKDVHKAFINKEDDDESGVFTNYLKQAFAQKP